MARPKQLPQLTCLDSPFSDLSQGQIRSFAQVVFLSENYLGSRACLLEFFTALLRRQAWQHLLVYCKFRTRPDPRPRFRPVKRAANKTL